MTEARPLGLVVGATHGPGLELARTFARNGFDLVIVDGGEIDIDPVANELRALGVEVNPVFVDLAFPDDVEYTLGEIRGDPRVLSAAAFTATAPVEGGFRTTETDELLKPVAANCSAMVQLIAVLARDMVAAGSGEIMFVSSDAAVGPHPGAAVYSATRAFLHSLALSLQEELASSGVNVTVMKESAGTG